MKHVIITGATGGLGSHIAKLCLEQEVADVFSLVDRSEERFKCFSNISCKATVNKIISNGVLDEETIIKSMCSGADETVLIHTAFSIMPMDNIGCFDTGQIKENIDGNILNFVILLNTLINNMTAGQCLKIVNIDSGAAYRPIPGWSLYCSGKAFINMFLKNAVAEYENIAAVTYEPGVIDTPMQNHIRQQDRTKFNWVKNFVDYKNNQQLNSPENIAEDIFTRYVLKWTTTDFQEGYKK